MSSVQKFLISPVASQTTFNYIFNFRQGLSPFENIKIYKNCLNNSNSLKKDAKKLKKVASNV